jgi:putative ABC transport system permease protein
MGTLPLAGLDEAARGQFTVEGQGVAEQQRNPYATFNVASPDVFETLRIPLLAGRHFTEDDRDGMAPVAIVSAGLARRFWPDGQAIGKRIRGGLPTDTLNRYRTIVGVVGDLTRGEVAEPPGLEIYVPYQQSYANSVFIVARVAAGNPMAISERAAAAVQRADPTQSTFDHASLTVRISDRLWRQRLSGSLFVAFAAVAALLAAVGIYGMLSYNVAQRTRELGIRAALGASPGAVRSLVLGSAVRLVALGIPAGLGGGWLLARAARSLLYDVRATHAPTYLTAAAFLALVALLAAYLPARRASSIAPVTALRQE